VEGLIGLHVQNVENSGLDPRTHALVRIASLITLGAPAAWFDWQVSLALESRGYGGRDRGRPGRRGTDRRPAAGRRRRPEIKRALAS
jgi:hypothetical protein